MTRSGDLLLNVTNKEGGIAVGIEKVAYFPDLALNPFF